jgi:hypothetical protein
MLRFKRQCVLTFYVYYAKMVDANRKKVLNLSSFLDKLGKQQTLTIFLCKIHKTPNF